MDTFAPEFSRYWLPADDADAQRVAVEEDDQARAEQQALEELAERVNAARSIV